MRLKGVVMEDFINYMKPSLFLITCMCDWKCCTEAHIPTTVCQNEPIVRNQTKEFSNESIYKTYISNDITSAIVIGGLEPMLQIDEVVSLIRYFREHWCDDDFVIYTGYYKDEITSQIQRLSEFKNIVIKFGRFKPNEQKHFDKILGIELVSSNQYAERIS